MEDSIKPLTIGALLGVAEHMPRASVSAVRHELMTLTLNGLRYGIDVNCVVDVRDPQPPVQMFNRPACLVGSVWIAGEHAPVIDLRLALGLPAPRGKHSVMVAVDMGERVIGAVVDAVGDIVAIPLGQVKPLEGAAGPIDDCYCAGVASAGANTLVLLDIVAWMTALNEMFEITSA